MRGGVGWICVTAAGRYQDYDGDKGGSIRILAACNSNANYSVNDPIARTIDPYSLTLQSKHSLSPGRLNGSRICSRFAAKPVPSPLHAKGNRIPHHRSLRNSHQISPFLESNTHSLSRHPITTSYNATTFITHSHCSLPHTHPTTRPSPELALDTTIVNAVDTRSTTQHDTTTKTDSRPTTTRLDV
jgi:hypothetical protein